jgi:hypothetical protein
MIYLIPTDDGNFTNFIATPPITSGEVFKTIEPKATFDHIVIPCFSKTKAQQLAAVLGDKIGAESEEKVILDAHESVSIEISGQPPLPGALELTDDNLVGFEEEFTFGMIYSKLDEEPFVLI